MASQEPEASVSESEDSVRHWLAEQVERYAGVRPRYESFANLLTHALEAAAHDLAPVAIVQARAKTVPSFAAKALRKRHKYSDPVNQLTDLCGARVITHTRGQVDALCEHIKTSFDIDWPNSLDTSQRLAPAEFGYRSVHYIVTPWRGVDYGVPVADELYGLKAEIQVRTLVEHAYADFVHDISYKGSFKLPRSWLRELAAAAAALESADRTFSAIEERLRDYATSYGAYLDDQQLKTEMQRLEIVREHDPENPDLAVDLARLARTREDWTTVVDTLSPFVDDDDPATSDPALLRDLGVALCKQHRGNPGGAEYRRGQRYLEVATEVSEPDPDTLASLAGTWKGIEEARAREYYRRAFEADPEDPYALGNHLERELERNPDLLDTARPLIRRGIDRCEAHAVAGVNLPWAYYDLGRFRLLAGEPYEALDAYARALSLTTASFMAEGSLASLRRMERLRDRVPGYDWSLRLLLLGAAVLFPGDESLARVQELATPEAAPFDGPILILAGGTDPRLEPEMKAYRDLLLDALGSFGGTLLSGGTTEGIAGIAGDAAERSGGRVRAVGYLPALIPGDATPDRDTGRYAELRGTDGHGFTPLEPLQNWIDLVASGVPADSVRVLGVNGGTIAAAEYRIALALGACVGLVQGSGREAGRIFTDAHWAGNRRLVRLPRDPDVVRAFLPAPEAGLKPEPRERVAREIHERYREEKRASVAAHDPALAGWEHLSEDLKHSSRAQADHIRRTLAVVGCRPASAVEAAESAGLSEEEIKRMAPVEHGRFVVERLLAGWRYGEERDHERRTSPYLVAWEELPEEVQELDRAAVRRIPELLDAVGMRVVREGGSGPESEAR